MARAPTDKIEASLERIAPDGKLGVAVSGGSDSTALLLVTSAWARRTGRETLAATVDHGLRSEAAAEAGAVAKLAAQLGVRHSVLHASEVDGPGNVSDRARIARFAQLAEWAERKGLEGVLLGHTMDDQAETVLMRLSRGSGVEGLSAMAPVHRRGGMLWLRPMLDVRRDELRDFLRVRGIGWVEDPTNENAQFERVRVRQTLAQLGALGIDTEGLARTAARLQSERRVLQDAAATLAARSLRWGGFGEAYFARPPLSQARRETALRLLGGCLTQVGARTYQPRRAALEDALDQVLSDGFAGTTLGGCLIKPWRDHVVICREPARAATPVACGPGAVLWDGRWRVERADHGSAEDHIGMLGDAGLSHLHLAARSGTWQAPPAWRVAPRLVRETVPALWCGTPARPENLVAVPHAAYVTGNAMISAQIVWRDDAIRPGAGR